jgi:hypothetical protein
MRRTIGAALALIFAVGPAHVHNFSGGFGPPHYRAPRGSPPVWCLPYRLAEAGALVRR